MAEIRSFIAIHVDEAIIARLAALQGALRQTGAPVSWTRPEGMHLTLKFLGNIREEQIAPIGAALQPVMSARAPFRMSIEGTGAFPTLRRPRVVWAGVNAGKIEVTDLASAVDAAMTGLGFTPEARPYSPHLTLGRVKEPAHLNQLTEQVQAHARDQFGEMQVREVIVFRSELSPKGARYTPLLRLPLGAQEHPITE